MSFGKENIIPSRRACRSLFGPVDHDEVKKTLAREMDVLDTRQKLRWNFDFKNEVPLAGKFHWERVTPDDTRVPVAYTVMLRHLEPKEDSSDDEDIPAEAKPVVVERESATPSTSLPDTCTPSQQQLENETTPPSQKPVSRKRKRSGQCAITGKLENPFILVQGQNNGSFVFAFTTNDKEFSFGLINHGKISFFTYMYVSTQNITWPMALL